MDLGEGAERPRRGGGGGGGGGGGAWDKKPPPPPLPLAQGLDPTLVTPT